MKATALSLRDGGILVRWLVWVFRLTAANSENSRVLSYNALGNRVIKLFSGDWAPRNHPWLYKYVSFPSSQEIGFFSWSDSPLQKMIVIFFSLALSSLQQSWFLVSVTYRVHGSRFMFSVQVSWNGWASHLRKDKCLLWYRDSNPFVETVTIGLPLPSFCAGTILYAIATCWAGSRVYVEQNFG